MRVLLHSFKLSDFLQNHQFVITADCERACSIMCRIKSRLRSEISNSTLNHCMRISMEGLPLQEFDFDAAVDAWSKLKNRRVFE